MALQDCCRWAVTIVVPLLACCPAWGGQAPAPPGLRIARSGDGAKFTDAGAFASGAGSAALLGLPDGTMLAAFNDLDASPPGIRVVRSRDGGRTWGRAEPLRFDDAGARLRPLHPSLVIAGSGTIRLYFYSGEEGAPGSGRGFIGSAVTRDGLTYTLDRSVRIAAREPGEIRPIAARLGRAVHLFLAPAAGAGRGTEPIPHLVSVDGRVFREARDGVSIPHLNTLVDCGSMVRLYASEEGGLVSYTSRDLRDWQREGKSLERASGAAVGRAGDGGYVMLYAAGPAAKGQGDEPLAVAPAETAQEVSQEAAAVEASAAPTGWEPLAVAYDPLGALGELDSLDAPVALAPIEDLLPPLPNWQDPTDYIAWLNARRVPPAEGNAYDVYSTFLAMPDDPPGSKPWWPESIDSMFNGEYNGDPYPWDPAAHPNWEAAAQTTAGLLEWFEGTAQLEQYVMPLGFTPRQIAEAPGGKPMAFEILLPALAQHRALVKIAMDHAWRAENGQLVPEQMVGNVETALRGARHMLQGPTLIHHLVGIAEQSLARDSARRALAFAQWTPEQIEAGLQTLRQYDRVPDDPVSWIDGEAAMGMDVLQHVFKMRADGKPVVDKEQAQRLMSATSTASQNGEAMLFLWTLSMMKKEDLDRTAQAFRDHAKEIGTAWRTGYPTVRAADLEAITKKHVATSPLTKILLPSLSRAYVMGARNEATRRGTQLTYAVHLFARQNGRWPASLDELPPTCASMRQDPFTGGDFNYRLTPTGPMIYSSSENGTDDGGIHSSRWDDAESVQKTGGSDDYVFWPVQPR